MTASCTNLEFQHPTSLDSFRYANRPSNTDFTFESGAILLKMVLDLFALTGTMTAVGGAEAVHQQRVLDQEANSEARRAPFYLDVYCDAQSRKRDEVHGATVILRDGKVPIPP